MLRLVSQQILIADVGSDKSVIRLKTVYIMEREESTSEHCQSRVGPYNIDWFCCVLVAHVAGILSPP